MTPEASQVNIMMLFGCPAIFATNAAALAYFVPSGHVLWIMGLAMAAFNIGGALLGARLALRHGSGFVRGVFVVVASVLIARLGYDTFA